MSDMKEKLAELVAALIFLVFELLLYAVYYMAMAILIIWVVEGITGIDISHAFLHVVVGIIVIKGLQANPTKGERNEHRRKD